MYKNSVIKKSSTVFLDVSKAFDTVSHPLFYNKLEQCGVWHAVKFNKDITQKNIINTTFSAQHISDIEANWY